MRSLACPARRYLISNCKDQTIKLWDLRQSLVPDLVAQGYDSAPVPRFRWDYRWMEFPGRGYDIRHPHDQSIATFRGHEVRATLIRGGRTFFA